MNISFLIGNGFDLNLGLKTKYIQFIDWLNENRLENSNDSINELHSSIEEFCRKRKKAEPYEINWSDTELAFGQYTNMFDDKKNGDEEIEECHTYLCEKLAEYLGNEEKRFSIQEIKEKKDILEGLSKSFYNCSKGLRPVDEQIIKNYIGSIGGGYNIDIVDFNYTNIIDLLVSTIREKNLMGHRVFHNTQPSNTIKMPIHVHGKLSHGLVFGLDNESQINTSIFTYDEPERMRAVIKKYYNEDMGEGIDERVVAAINNSNILYIYGMSLGETDQRWWKGIIDKLKNDNTCILIIHNMDVPEISLRPAPYMRYCRLSRESFLRYSPKISDDEKKKIKDRIYFTSANIFSDIENIISD